MNLKEAIQSANLHATTAHARAKADAVERDVEPTPGPWAVQPREGPAFAENVISTPDGRVIAMALCGIRGNFATAEANARLLAAAPELLEALEAMIELREIHEAVKSGREATMSALHRARSAIAKTRN